MTEQPSCCGGKVLSQRRGGATACEPVGRARAFRLGLIAKDALQSVTSSESFGGNK